MRTLPFVALMLSAALIGAPASAQIYKWTDAKGQVHFGDQPPPNATQIRGPTPPGASAPPPAPAPAIPAAPPAPPGSMNTDGPASSDATSNAVRRDVQAVKSERCKKAKTEYDGAIRAQRMFRTNEKGEREYMNSAEIDAARVRIRAEMDAACAA